MTLDVESSLENNVISFFPTGLNKLIFPQFILGNIDLNEVEYLKAVTAGISINGDYYDVLVGTSKAGDSLGDDTYQIPVINPKVKPSANPRQFMEYAINLAKPIALNSNFKRFATGSNPIYFIDIEKEGADFSEYIVIQNDFQKENLGIDICNRLESLIQVCS